MAWSSCLSVEKSRFAGMVALVACLRRRQSLIFLRSLDQTDIMMGVALAIAFATYVYACC